jgi:hypothetical protein
MRTVARVELKVSTVQRDRHFTVTILKELLNKIWLFWVAILYSLLNRYRHFGLVKFSLFRVVNSSFTATTTEIAYSSIPPINIYKSVGRYAPEKSSVILKSLLSVCFVSFSPYLLLTKRHQFASEGDNTRDTKFILDGRRGETIFKLMSSSRVTICRTWAYIGRIINNTGKAGLTQCWGAWWNQCSSWKTVNIT